MTDIEHSQLDSRRFGCRIFRARVQDLTTAERAVSFKDADMMIARVPAHDLEVAQQLEAGGFFLTDVLVVYRGSTATFLEAPKLESVLIRDFEGTDRGRLERVAETAFTDFGGHYHRDPKLDKTLATAGYVEWCLSATARQDGFVLVAVVQDELVGFLTAAIEGSEGDIVLNGVSPTYQRRGIYRALFQTAGRRFCEGGLSTIKLSTQLTNIGPQKICVRHGLELSESFLTFHKWF